MADWPVLFFAFLIGVAVSGLSASAASIVAKRPAGFYEPFISRRHMATSLLLTAFAGPMMLVNDTMQARRRGDISWPFAVSCLATAGAWSLASGILVSELAWRLGILVS